MNDEWWWMMMTMISIRILIRFDDYPASGGNKLRMLRANKLMCLCSRRQHSWLTGPKGPQQCLGTVLWLLFSLGWVGIWMFEWFDLVLSGPGTFFWFDLTSSLRFEYLFYPSAPAKHLWHLQYRHHGFAVDMFFHFSCSLYWCNMLTQFDTIPCGCSLAVDD